MQPDLLATSFALTLLGPRPFRQRTSPQRQNMPRQTHPALARDRLRLAPVRFRLGKSLLVPWLRQSALALPLMVQAPLLVRCSQKLSSRLWNREQPRVAVLPNQDSQSPKSARPSAQTIPEPYSRRSSKPLSPFGS